MASYLDARAHRGLWLLRIEDIDPPREVPGASEQIISSLAELGFCWDGPIEFQSRRTSFYQQAFDRLMADGQLYACACSRKEIGDRVYPGTCRNGMPPGAVARAFRVRSADKIVEWVDRLAGHFIERVDQAPGDFVIKRADGLWAYQLAVAIDDALQDVSHVVRGDDLMESTARQILLQELLGLPRPVYMHVPVIKAGDGQKLSKQTGAKALNSKVPIPELTAAAHHLQLGVINTLSLADFWAHASLAWANRYRLSGQA